jgi:tetratricopeptide (TPR) repeat protein
VNERLSKQDLKNDPLMRHTGEVVDFAQHHVRILLGTAAALVVAVVVVVILRGAGARADDVAAGMLAEARGDLAKANPDAAAARLHDILEFHGGTTSGKQALLLNADIRFDQGRYDEALTYYERAARAFAGDPVLGATAQRGLAATYENQGNHAKAVEIYEALYGQTQDPLLRAELGLDLARNYVKLQRDADAERVYQEVAKNPVNIRAAQEAKQLLAEVRSLRAASRDPGIR